MKNQNFILKCLCLMLAIVMVTAPLFSCSDGGKGKSEETTTDKTESDTNPIDYRTLLPNATFDNADVKIYCLDAREDMFHTIDNENNTSNSYDEAVYTRNSIIEEKYQVVIDVYAKANKKEDFVTMCQISSMSGECEYDIIETERFFSLEKNGELLNLMDFDVLEFDNPYWIDGYNNKTTINGKCYSAVGYMNRCIISNAEVLFANYYIMSDFGIRNDIYDAINTNTWTLQKMSEYMALATRDIDGNGFDFNDDYGLSYNLHAGRSFFLSAGLELLTVDSNGTVTNNATTLRNSDIFDKVKEVLITNQNAYFKNARLLETDDSAGKLFVDGRSMFHAESFDFVPYVSAKYAKYDIFPMPLYEENNAYVTALKECTSSAIHINAKNPEMSATIIEAMNILSYLDVMPVYYDKMLKGRYSSNAETKSMIDLIVDSINIDFAFVQTDYFDRIADKPFDLALDNKGYMSGMSTFDKLFSSYLENFYKVYGLLLE